MIVIVDILEVKYATVRQYEYIEYSDRRSLRIIDKLSVIIQLHRRKSDGEK